MAAIQRFSLSSIRTDGWFDRLGEGIGSFQALCEIIGPRFFAFAMITGARIIALNVDRRTPANTEVEFLVGGDSLQDPQRLRLGQFRQRLVAALLAELPPAPAPKRSTDTESLQLFIGVRFLLLAPLYGYGLEELLLSGAIARIRVSHDGEELDLPLSEFQARLRNEVRQELDRAQRGAEQRGVIDLSRVPQAAEAARTGDYGTVFDLLGAWPAPLAIFLRTPEGQMLATTARATIAEGLGLLGEACIRMREIEKGEEVLRLAIQYAGDNGAAPIYLRLGRAMLEDGRAGQAIGPLRRAIALGQKTGDAWLVLAEALLRRGWKLAAFGALQEARAVGLDQQLAEVWEGRVGRGLGEPFRQWRKGEAP